MAAKVAKQRWQRVQTLSAEYVVHLFFNIEHHNATKTTRLECHQHFIADKRNKYRTFAVSTAAQSSSKM